MLLSVRSSTPSTKNCSYFRIKNTYLFVATKFSDQGQQGLQGEQEPAGPQGSTIPSIQERMPIGQPINQQAIGNLTPEQRAELAAGVIRLIQP
jgi:hypothetical protein